ncbi:tripartite tricarboxylate transporter substrate binding protein [Mycolicibacterium psychrotolerans]|uniref:C4-dicarboxylate ABC transporter substrate-binding protein n=1 Tax=Mycolicibacterium psychrotolerans TaxID=216929 RepID=A0A7I7M788_9MYCO|nr:tripartite tricarboxylate transporter substrate-binding protein [Mycolicibacterium psychrotolerans]BBX67239.1 C4-dicarboxylate ABC transporter substrate-binding protein [Mycolicibacterium psychrotolerans]
MAVFRLSVIGALLTAILLVAGCQRSEPVSESGAAPKPYPSAPITMTAGAGPGSGFDLTIRAVVEALQTEHLVDVPLTVANRPGRSGADQLATMVEQHAGTDDQISVTSLSMMMNQIRGVSPYGYRDVTIIARLMTEYFVVVTDPAAPFANLGDVMTAVKTRPGDLAVGAAKDDEAPFDLLVSAALRAGHIPVAIGGLSEFVDEIRAGKLRVLAVLAENPVPGVDAPTAREQGLDVTLSNWRGLYGPPGMPEQAVAYWQKVLGEMVRTPTWKRIADQRQFITAFLTGDELGTFLGETQADVTKAFEEASR